MSDIEKELHKTCLPLIILGIVLLFVHGKKVDAGMGVVYRTIFLVVAVIQWVGVIGIAVQKTQIKIRQTKHGLR